MSPAKKRILFAVVIAILVLTACAPAPVPTQTPALAQRVTEQSMTLAAAETSAAEKDQQLSEQSAALAIASQTAEAIGQQTPTPSTTFTPASPGESPAQTIDPEQATFEAIVASAQAQQASYTPTVTPTATDTPIPTVTPGSLADLNAFLSSKDETFDDCTYQIVSAGFVVKELTVKRNDRLNIGIGSKVIIIRPVNLRRGPALFHQILMTLRKDPTYIPSANPSPIATQTAGPSPTPGPTATADPNRVVYEIIGGPGYSNFGATIASANPSLDGTDEVSPFRVEGRKYKWWKIRSLDDPKITGWVVEASACGLYNFIEPVTN